MNIKSISLISLSLALPLAAQNDMDIETGAGSTNWITRTSTAAQSACVTRWDASDYASIGFDLASPGTNLAGASVYYYDFENPGVESFNMVAVSEAGATSAPDWTTMTPISGAVTAPLAGGWEFRTTFSTSLNFAAGSDFFIGCDIGPLPVTETNGMWFYTVRSIAAAAPVIDLGGPAVDISTTIADTYTHGTLDYVANLQFSKRYLLCDVNVVGAGGMATSITNQAGMPSSAVAPGIAGFYSGLHPDVNAFNAGRVDDPGFSYLDISMAGQSVLFFISFSGFNPTPIPLSVVFAGSTGSWCLNDGLFLGSLTADPSGAASINLPIDPATRAVLGGSGLAAQMYAVGFDGARLSGSPCANVVY